MNRLVTAVVLAPLAIILIALAVANRAPAALTLDPFNPGNPALTYSAPFFVYLFGALALGVALGGAACWLTQGRYRRIARQRISDDKAAAKRERESVKRSLALPAPTTR